MKEFIINNNNYNYWLLELKNLTYKSTVNSACGKLREGLRERINIILQQKIVF